MLDFFFFFLNQGVRFCLFALMAPFSYWDPDIIGEMSFSCSAVFMMLTFIQFCKTSNSTAVYKQSGLNRCKFRSKQV